MSLYADYITERTNDLIIEHDKGFATYRYLNEKQVYVIDIFVSQEFRSSGYALQLVNEIANKAKLKGCTEMIGTVVPSTKNSTYSLKGLFWYGMKLDSATNDLIVCKKEI